MANAMTELLKAQEQARRIQEQATRDAGAAHQEAQRIMADAQAEVGSVIRQGALTAAEATVQQRQKRAEALAKQKAQGSSGPAPSPDPIEDLLGGVDTQINTQAPLKTMGPSNGEGILGLVSGGRGVQQQGLLGGQGTPSVQVGGQQYQAPPFVGALSTQRDEELVRSKHGGSIYAVPLNRQRFDIRQNALTPGDVLGVAQQKEEGQLTRAAHERDFRRNFQLKTMELQGNLAYKAGILGTEQDRTAIAGAGERNRAAIAKATFLVNFGLSLRKHFGPDAPIIKQSMALAAEGRISEAIGLTEGVVGLGDEITRTQIDEQKNHADLWKAQAEKLRSVGAIGGIGDVRSGEGLNFRLGFKDTSVTKMAVDESGNMTWTIEPPDQSAAATAMLKVYDSKGKIDSGAASAALQASTLMAAQGFLLNFSARKEGNMDMEWIERWANGEAAPPQGTSAAINDLYLARITSKIAELHPDKIGSGRGYPRPEDVKTANDYLKKTGFYEAGTKGTLVPTTVDAFTEDNAHRLETAVDDWMAMSEAGAKVKLPGGAPVLPFTGPRGTVAPPTLPPASAAPAPPGSTPTPEAGAAPPTPPTLTPTTAGPPSEIPPPQALAGVPAPSPFATGQPGVAPTPPAFQLAPNPRRNAAEWLYAKAREKQVARTAAANVLRAKIAERKRVLGY